mgnify:CR=1 FL=1
MDSFRAVLEVDGGYCKEIAYLHNFIGLCDYFIQVAGILGVYLRLKGLVYALEQKDHLFVDKTYYSVTDLSNSLDLLEGEAVQIVYQIAAYDYLTIIWINGKLDVFLL